VITPRWLYVLAAATPLSYGTPILVDETLATTDPETIAAGDVVGISIHTGNALRGYELARLRASAERMWFSAASMPRCIRKKQLNWVAPHAVVKGDGDVAWARVLNDCAQGKPETLYVGGRIEGREFLPARWDLLPPNSYMWASVQTVRGCPSMLVLLSVAHGRAASPAAALRFRDGRDRQPAPPGLSFYRAGRRQFLSRNAD